MQNLQNNKIVQVTAPGAIVDNASVATTVIDTKGFEELAVYVILGAIDIAMTALKLQHSDQAGSGFVDLADSDYATDLPSATEDNTIVGWFVDLRGKDRYVDVVATAGDGAVGTYITIIAILSRGKQTPATAAKRGLSKQKVL